MHSTEAFGALIVLLHTVLGTPNQGISAPEHKSEEWIPSDISIAYLNWIKERGATVSTTLPSNIKITSIEPQENGIFYQISNASDLLLRYRETEREQHGKVIESLFNTPGFETTTSIPEIYILSSVPQTNKNGSSKEPPYGKVSVGVIVVLTIVASSITIGGNILVLAAFYVERTLRMPTNYFIASLAVTDVLIGIFSMNLYSLYLLLGYWPLGRLLCDLWLGLDYTLCLTSQYTVLFITLDRFFSVKIPAKYRNWRSGNKVLAMIAITWILPSTIFFTTILGWPYFSKHNHVRKSGTCYAEFSSNPMFNTILTIAYFWITLSVMTGLYIGIYMVALRLQKKSEKKMAKVKNLLTMPSQNISCKSGGSTVNETEMEFGESYHLASSNETGARVTSGEFDSGTNAQNHSTQLVHTSTTFKVDTTKEDAMPYCGPVTPHHNPPAMDNPSLPPNAGINSVYANNCFFDPSSYPVGSYSPKASPTSIAETVFVDIRSPHLSDPEISDTTKILEKNYYSFPSSPAVHVFSDLETSCSSRSDGSSLKLSFAYSQEFAHNSFNGSSCGPPSVFKKDQDYNKTLDDFKCATPNYECRSIQDNKRNSNSDQNVKADRQQDDGNVSQLCPLIDMLPSPINMTTRRVSKATAVRVAQIWQDRLMMQTENQVQMEKDHKLSHEIKRRRASDNSRNSGNDTTDSRTIGMSKKPLRVGKKNVLNSYFQRVHDTNVSVTRQAPLERGRTANRARKALKTISLILGAFVLCWTPYHIVILIKGFCDDPQTTYTCVNHHLYSVTYWMCYMNSPINPFCYALANAQFKQAFLRILRMDLNRR
ncbi:putative muscarinic acetylcholine receptor gar-2 [Echinococcus granulosus]|nr:putative muscarinic acetylcholine receptor gar-2 [Echinococcus granulosus]